MHSWVHFGINFIKRRNCNQYFQGSYGIPCTAYNLWTFTWIVHFELFFRLKFKELNHFIPRDIFLPITNLCSVVRVLILEKTELNTADLLISVSDSQTVYMYMYIDLYRCSVIWGKGGDSELNTADLLISVSDSQAVYMYMYKDLYRCSVILGGGDFEDSIFLLLQGISWYLSRQIVPTRGL